ncbi:MAG: TIGR04076 family protein [Erysipelotrichaceae bacterium]|nr:TIGR04076 family protein [Erysipelotrichaceae bacterium]
MKIKISVVDQLGKRPCHRGLKVGDTFDYEEDRGKICPQAFHMLYPKIDVLRYGGTLPTNVFCCPDVDSILVFKIERIDE